MTTYNRASLKTFFEQNDVPTGTDYANLIDSCLNIVDTAAQTIASSIQPTELITPRVSATNANITTMLSASSVNIATMLSANNVNISGTLSGISGFSISGIVSAASVNVTGDVRATTGTVYASAMSVSSLVSAAAVNVAGIVSAAGLVFTSSAGIVGTTTNNNVNPGTVGEFVTSTVAGSTTSLSNGVTANTTTISLTAGDWDVWGWGDFNPANTTITTDWAASINTTSATLGTVTMRASLNNTSTGRPYTLPIPVQRISIASTTTIYLVVFAEFSVSTQTAGGTISARRMR